MTSILSCAIAQAAAAPGSSVIEYEGEIIKATGCCAELPIVEHDHLWCMNLSASCGTVTAPAPTATVGNPTVTFPDGSSAPTASDEVTARFIKKNVILQAEGNLPAAGDSCLTEYLVRRDQLAKHAVWAPATGIKRTIEGAVIGAGIETAPTIIAIVGEASTAASGLSSAAGALGAGMTADAAAAAEAAAQASQAALTSIGTHAALLPAELMTGAEIGGAVVFGAYAAWQTELIVKLVRFDHVIDILREARLGGGTHIRQLVKRLHRKVRSSSSSSLSLIEPDNQDRGYSPLATIHGQMLGANGNSDGFVKLTIPCSEQDPLSGGCNFAASEEAIVAHAIESLDRQHAFCDGVLARPGKKASKKFARNIVPSEGKIIKSLMPYVHSVESGKVVATIQAPLVGHRGYVDNGITRLAAGTPFPDLDGSTKDSSNRTIKLSGIVIDLTPLR